MHMAIVEKHDTKLSIYSAGVVNIICQIYKPKKILSEYTSLYLLILLCKIGN